MADLQALRLPGADVLAAQAPRHSCYYYCCCKSIRKSCIESLPVRTYLTTHQCHITDNTYCTGSSQNRLMWLEPNNEIKMYCLSINAYMWSRFDALGVLARHLTYIAIRLQMLLLQLKGTHHLSGKGNHIPHHCSHLRTEQHIHWPNTSQTSRMNGDEMHLMNTRCTDLPNQSDYTHLVLSYIILHSSPETIGL